MGPWIESINGLGRLRSTHILRVHGDSYTSLSKANVLIYKVCRIIILFERLASVSVHRVQKKMEPIMF